MIDSGQVDINHDPDIENWLILTAPGDEVAKLLERFADDSEAFTAEKGFELRR